MGDDDDDELLEGEDSAGVRWSTSDARWEPFGDGISTQHIPAVPDDKCRKWWAHRQSGDFLQRDETGAVKRDADGHMLGNDAVPSQCGKCKATENLVPVLMVRQSLDLQLATVMNDCNRFCFRGFCLCTHLPGL